MSDMQANDENSQHVDNGSLDDERDDELAALEAEADDYEGFDEEVERIQRLFGEKRFVAMERARNVADPLKFAKSNSANGSIGRALALGMANVFDPDRVKEDVVVVQEKGQGDPDVPETTIDPDDPTTTKVTYRAR
jgi:hypothetical protein